MTIVNVVIDICFFIDILINFNTVIFNDDYVKIENRRTIAKEYLCGWFLIDFMAIIPVDLIIQN